MFKVNEFSPFAVVITSQNFILCEVFFAKVQTGLFISETLATPQIIASHVFHQRNDQVFSDVPITVNI